MLVFEKIASAVFSDPVAITFTDLLSVFIFTFSIFAVELLIDIALAELPFFIVPFLIEAVASSTKMASLTFCPVRVKLFRLMVYESPFFMV
ncbi:hypothetical protein [Desulfovibrio piger]